MSLNKLFEKIYVINLKRRKDRRILCSQKLESLGIKFQYIDGIDGYDNKYDALSDIVLKKEVTWIKSRGAVGLLLTYLVILEDALAKKYNNILILEDDVNFHKDFETQLKKAQKNINFDEVDCLWLGANQYRYDAAQEAQLDKPDCEFYTVSRKKWCYTFGTYAIAFNRKFMLELRRSIDMNEIIYAIDVHIFWTLANAGMNGRILMPFLVLPDVTDSDNMGVRDQNTFSAERKYKLSDYKFISIADIGALKKILDTKKISLRQLFSDFSTGTLSLDQGTFINAFKNIKHIDQTELDNILRIGQIVFNYYEKNNKIILTDLFRSIEERKSFVFIVPSYNNEQNFKINLDSMRKQIYPGYQTRIIYVNDSSDDSTEQCVQEYIKRYKMENYVTYVNMDKCQDHGQRQRQRQGMGRYIAYHKCFDDEICLNLDGDDWLFNEFVLDTLDKHFTDNDILVSYGSYYVYDENDVGSGQHMGIPYNSGSNGKPLNLRQFPEEIKANRSFKEYDWISGHLRSGYAKLFKSIESKHLMGPDGYFFRMASDQSEMFPVLEMAGSRHLNVLKPTMIYNKYNSKQFNTSFYKMNDEDNKESKKYREDVTQMIKQRPMYPLIRPGPLVPTSDSASFRFIKASEFSKPVDTLINMLRGLKVSYIYVDKRQTLMSMPLVAQSLTTSKPGIMLIDPMNPGDHCGAVIKVNESTSYAVKKINELMTNLLSDSVANLRSSDSVANPWLSREYVAQNPGFYHRQKLIQILEQNPETVDEVVLIPLKIS